MRFALAYQIWEAASTDEGRPVLCHVRLNVEKERLEATNSYFLAVVPCMIEDGDETGLIPWKALKAAARAYPKPSDGMSASLAVGTKTATLVDREKVTTIWPLLDGPFPNVDDLLKRNVETMEHPHGYNPEFFHKIGKAVGSAGKGSPAMTIHFSSPLKASKVEGRGDAFGILMPVRVSG